jgi:hypothetical protein
MWKYLNLYRIILRQFGFRLRPIGTFSLLQFHHLFSALTLAADRVVYPGFRAIPLDRPIFVLGNPRSGTTFIHRFLLNTERMAAFQLWEMLFPAICARKMLAGVIHRFAPLSPARYHSSAAHETGLRDVETDDALAFFHFVDGGFLWSYFLAWEDEWGSERSHRYFDLDNEPQADVERLFRYMEACWRRNLYYHRQRRIIVKASSFTLRVRTLLKRYPDCRLIYMVRDPVETIPSGMSLLTGVLEKAYDMFHSTREEARRQYLENLYQASVQLYRAFHDVWRSGDIPKQNLRLVSYNRMMTDLEGTMAELMDFLEIDPAPQLQVKLAEQSQKQRNHHSEHQYSLEKFGLTEERIRRDLAFVYQDYEL